MSDLTQIIVPATATALEAMRAIDRSGLEVALVCDDARRLLAVVTDGDLRRALLGGKSLDLPAVEVGNRRFTSVKPGTPRADVVALMLDKSFKSVPVLDEQGRLEDLITLHGALSTATRPNWAVIMAGGKGERLGELTQAIPKPMLPIGDKPIIEHIVNLLVGHGIRRIFISVNYLGRMIEDHFGDGSKWRAKISYLREDRPLGTGGALSLLPEKPTAPILVMNGDLVTAVNLGRMLDEHARLGVDATVGLRDHVVKVPFGVVEHVGGRVTALREKPTLHYAINAGIYCLEPSILAGIPGDRLYPITELLDACMKGRGLGAFHIQENWNDVGLPEEYAAASRR